MFLTFSPVGLCCRPSGIRPSQHTLQPESAQCSSFSSCAEGHSHGEETKEAQDAPAHNEGAVSEDEKTQEAVMSLTGQKHFDTQLRALVKRTLCEYAITPAEIVGVLQCFSQFYLEQVHGVVYEDDEEEFVS